MEGIDLNKTFRFVLKQNDVLLYEKMFDANKVSSYTRNSVDIRELIPDIIYKIQKLLTKNKYQTRYLFKDDIVYDFYDYNSVEIDKYQEQYREGMVYDPQNKTKKIDGKEYYGVEFLFGLYINKNPIIERFFYLTEYNKLVRWSNDLVVEMNAIVNDIFDYIVKKDVNNIWDDYDIIKKTNMTIYQVRELSESKRKYLINK